MVITNVSSDADLIGDLIIQIDPKTKLLRSIDVSDFESLEVQYSGTSCNSPEEKISGFYDIVSTESETFLVEEIEGEQSVQKQFELFERLKFIIGRIEI